MEEDSLYLVLQSKRPIDMHDRLFKLKVGRISQPANIIDKAPGAVDEFLAKHTTNYQQEPMFQRLVQATKADPNNPGLKDEFAATKWLEVNRPDYRDVVAATMDELKKEIIAHRDAILGGAGAPSAPQQTQQGQGDFDLAA